MKVIRFTKHALTQMKERKATEAEVKEAILTCPWDDEEKGRKSCHKTFPFSAEHYGRYYKSKDVVPIFAEEQDKIMVITVYTFFSQKEVDEI